MNRRTNKQKILSMLNQHSFDRVADALDTCVPQDAIHPLFSALCHPVETVRWHAVFSFGLVVPRIALKDVEQARVIMRRFLWSLNDESGGIGWGVPEAMGEVMYNSETLRHEYLHMLISYTREDGDELFQDGNFLELPMLQRGLLWAIGRICERYPKEILKRGSTADFKPYLASDDAQVTGLALRCLGFLGAAEYREEIRQWVDEEATPVRIWEPAGPRDLTLGAIARSALQRFAITDR